METLVINQDAAVQKPIEEEEGMANSSIKFAWIVKNIPTMLLMMTLPSASRLSQASKLFLCAVSSEDRLIYVVSGKARSSMQVPAPLYLQGSPSVRLNYGTYSYTVFSRVEDTSSRKKEKHWVSSRQYYQIRTPRIYLASCSFGKEGPQIAFNATLEQLRTIPIYLIVIGIYDHYRCPVEDGYFFPQKVATALKNEEELPVCVNATHRRKVHREYHEQRQVSAKYEMKHQKIMESEEAKKYPDSSVERMFGLIVGGAKEVVKVMKTVTSYE
jgi:hypothetical protein